jgi:DNA-binding response OmpR family regulator
VRILVVDNYGWSGQALTRLLKLQGYEARWADSAAEAVRLCEAEHFDLLIADLRLSDGSGSELFRQLVERCGIVGISLTAEATDGASQESHDAGFAAHFVKPLSFDVLCGAIRRVVPTANL